MVDWHPRRLVRPVEWLVVVPGSPDPIAVIRRLRLGGVVRYRAVTWSERSGGRRLIGYYADGDAAAVAVWRHHLEVRAAGHELASRTHGGAERGGPSGAGRT